MWICIFCLRQNKINVYLLWFFIFNYIFTYLSYINLYMRGSTVDNIYNRDIRESFVFLKANTLYYCQNFISFQKCSHFSSTISCRAHATSLDPWDDIAACQRALSEQTTLTSGPGNCFFLYIWYIPHRLK